MAITGIDHVQVAAPTGCEEDARTFYGGHDWLAENGVEVVLLDDPECIEMMTQFIAEKPEVWFEDIGED